MQGLQNNSKLSIALIIASYAHVRLAFVKLIYNWATIISISVDQQCAIDTQNVLNCIALMNIGVSAVAHL